ncbi:MAG: secretin and TonB N-terminal domain-containing protein [Candidatus Omnitrophica bacterium]|nr:secretin and TonB N-terminal domain-containing protein [Candidatus Omnitrophota bacterium]
MRFFRAFITFFVVAGLAVFPGAAGGQEEEKEAPPVQVAQMALPELPELSLISLDFKEAEIGTVLQAMARKAKINIVLGKEVAGFVTIHLEDVTWEQALDVIVKTYGFAYEKDENVILVSTLEDLKTRRQAVKELVDIEPVTTKVIYLKYLDAADVKAFLEPQLTAQGKISVLEMTGQKGWSFGTGEAGSSGTEESKERQEREKARSKAVVITDTPTTIDRLEKILMKIDVMPKQILIESRVMEVNRDLLRDLGIELGTGSSSTTLSTSAGFVSSTGARTFSQQVLEEKAEAANSNFGGSVLSQFLTPSIFVPETTGLTAANTGLSLVLRKLRGTQLEMLIRALEEDVRTNTLSAPNVLTLSGQEARILVGTKYPILETQVSGTDSTTTTTSLAYYQNIGIELYVVPQVSGDKHIDMIIHPVVSTRTGTVGTNAYPILDVREAETQIISENGETIVIGGLLKDLKAKSRIGLPFLGKLPLVGPLFSRSTTDLEKIDLLIFITARIVEPGSTTPEEVQRLQKKYQEFVEAQRPRRRPRPASVRRPAKAKAETEPPKGNRGFLKKIP